MSDEEIKIKKEKPNIYDENRCDLKVQINILKSYVRKLKSCNESNVEIENIKIQIKGLESEVRNIENKAAKIKIIQNNIPLYIAQLNGIYCAYKNLQSDLPVKNLHNIIDELTNSFADLKNLGSTDDRDCVWESKFRDLEFKIDQLTSKK